MIRGRAGFTLIELLIVVVIIGILAGIAIPKFALTKERAMVVTMKTDLRNLMTAQERYYVDHMEYGPDVATVGANQSADVTITITVAGNGWSAHAVHGQTGIACDIYTGDAATTAGELDGAPVCS